MAGKEKALGRRRSGKQSSRSLLSVSNGDGVAPRFLVALIVLAVVGMAPAAYLTVTAFTEGTAAFCESDSGCGIVQASRYARFLGIPVALIGLLGFATMAGVAVSPLSWRVRGLILYGLVVMGFTFSAYLQVVEFFVIHAVCEYCIAIFVIMTAILVVLLVLFRVTSLFSLARSALFSVVIAGLVLAISSGVYASQAGPEGDPYAVGLAKHLTAQGAAMYGGYTCPHCQQQKELFGDAFKYVTYVECYRGGKDAQPELCNAKGIRFVPTWEIGGVMYEGMMPLEELAELSNYTPEEQ